MNDHIAVLRLLIVVQIFLLLAILSTPILIHFLHEPVGKLAYALLTVFCIAQALLLRRAFTKLP